MKLEEIRFQTPCSVPWDSMKGSDTVRLCEQCRKNVYNVSAMSREEAEKFITKTNGTECIQLWTRADGTIVTSDCGRPEDPMHTPPERLGGAPVAHPG